MKQKPISENLQKTYAKVFALSGIMGSGKSTAAKIFSELGANIISADVLAKQVTSLHYKNYSQIRKQIETLSNMPMYLENGELDTRALSAAVFPNLQLLERLNNIIHPHVAKLFQEKVHSLELQSSAIIIYDIPLLYESGIDKFTKANIVVYAPEDICIERAMQRTSLPRQEIKNRLERQISIEEKKNQADYVLENQFGFDELENEVKRIWHKIKN